MRLAPFALALTCAISTVASGQGPAAKGTVQSRATIIARIDSLAKAYVAEGPSASITIGIVKGRDTLMMRGYGVADRAAKRPAGPTTVYEIGSLTKQITASAVLRLVEAGKIGLEDDISNYVPNFPLHGQHVTVHNLLNHTSGIHNYTNVAAWQPHWQEDLTPDSIVGYVAKDTLDFAPGAKMSYSNTGYVLLGMIIEKASGKRYAQFIDEQFFKPLKLTSTRYCPNHPNDTSFAVGYSVHDKVIGPSTYLSMTHPFAAGALCSSVHDYLVWQHALHTGGVVSARSYAAMTTPGKATTGKPLTYAFGLSIDTMNGHPVIDHGGGIPGFATAAMYFPADSLNVVVFTNTDGGGTPELFAGTAARIVFGLPLTDPLFDRMKR